MSNSFYMTLPPSFCKSTIKRAKNQRKCTIFFGFSEREYFGGVASKVRLSERNAKGKLVFLLHSRAEEMLFLR